MHRIDFNIHFDQAFATFNQNKFEEWFSNMASRIHGLDFELIKAGGLHGDKKSDGRLISSETVFQCYAPESPDKFAAKAPDKIRDSFPEVVEYWPNIKNWIFVHNNAGGIPASTSDVIEEIRRTYPHIKIECASRSFLKDELHDKLTVQQMIDIYPVALNFKNVTMAHIRPILKNIIQKRTAEPDPMCFGDIPDEKKLEYNELSLDAKRNIGRARPYVDIVGRALSQMSNPDHAAFIQAEMRSKYIELKDFGHNPDEILAELLTFCGATMVADVTAAAYVFVTYYLDSCDVFENVPEVA